MQVQNEYYQWSVHKQRNFQIKLISIFLLCILLIGLILYFLYRPLILLLPLLLTVAISVLAPFVDVPAMVKKGRLKYYSLFFLAEQEHKGIIKVHGGTLFDYYFVLDEKMSQRQRLRLILLEYLKGLHQLAQEENEELIVEGSSYIINERTANKLGFKRAPLDGLQMIVMAFNYINLILAVSMAKKALQFPKLNRMNTFRGRLKDIKEKSQYVKQLIVKLEGEAMLY
ncbi:hypothetical protein PZB74_15335 [Porifericola rhodea]|uniref:hypothetical protein n=1 Tax=Porifericola rhodea TaxID=930972 RepID=UPI0026659851|nr:hypothetical protein [Porifericola rhodea]WKN30337.1 hypothetical protein PZB74_15335 [Porifericola rhodea]